MKRHRWLVSLLGATLVFWAGPGGGLAAEAVPETSPDRKALVAEVLELSGARLQIEQIPALVLAELEEQRAQADPTDYATVVAIFSQAYRADRLLEVVVGHLGNHADEARLRRLLDWFRSPLAQKMTQLEVEASTPEAQRKRRSYAEQLEWNPPTEARMDLIERMNQAGQLTETSIRLQLATLEGIVEGLNPLLPPGKRLEKQQLEELLSVLRGQLQGPAKTTTLNSLLYTYRRATQPELAQYVTFLESDLGRWFSRLLSEGLLQAMRVAAREAGKRIAETAPQPSPDGRS